MHVVVRYTLGCVALLAFFVVVVSHGRERSLGVILCALLMGVNTLAGGRHGWVRPCFSLLLSGSMLSVCRQFLRPV